MTTKPFVAQNATRIISVGSQWTKSGRKLAAEKSKVGKNLDDFLADYRQCRAVFEEMLRWILL